MNVRLLNNEELIKSIYILNTLYIETYSEELIEFLNQVKEEISYREKYNLNSGYIDISLQ